MRDKGDRSSSSYKYNRNTFIKNYIDRSYDEKSGYVITRKSQMEYELNPLAYTLYNGEEETQLKLDKWGWQPAY